MFVLPRPARAVIGSCVVFCSLLVAVVLAQEQESSLPAAIGLFQQQDHPAAAAMFERILDAEPGNGRAWVFLGMARQQMGDLDGALVAALKAADIEASRDNGRYNAACIHALMGDSDAALALLRELKSEGNMDLTGIALDNDLEILHEDPRLATLLPTPEEYADSFVEDVRVLHEWRGEAQGDQFGWIARNIGDVDGDRANDVVSSAPSWGSEGSNAGKLYVYSGRTGTLLWEYVGEPGDQLGMGVEAAGDVDADGVPDVIAGAPGGGRALVLSGVDGSVLHDLKSTEADETFGAKVSDLGDVDGDGHDDVLVGAPGNDGVGENAGRAYLFSGRDGVLLRSYEGRAAGEGFGSAGAGRYDDAHRILAIGAPGAGESGGGATYVYRDDAREPSFVMECDDTGANLGGMFVSIIGDVDADGTPDVYASDWNNNALGRSTGRIYVHSGATGERLHTLTGEAAGDGFGIGPADAGDVDGDGHDDLIVGAWRHGGAAPAGGKVYLHSGRDGSLLRAITCKLPGDTFGFDATGMGDVDGDGLIDFLLSSAWSAVNGARSGRVFLIAGKP